MSITTLETDHGLPYKEACEILERNKEKLEKHGSDFAIRNCGFYVRKVPVNRMGTGYDFVCMVTGKIRTGNENKKSPQIFTRRPEDHNMKSHGWFEFSRHWKYCNNEAHAKHLWEFWYKCGAILHACVLCSLIRRGVPVPAEMPWHNAWWCMSAALNARADAQRASATLHARVCKWSPGWVHACGRESASGR
jgi:hypothetical protein